MIFLNNKLRIIFYPIILAFASSCIIPGVLPINETVPYIISPLNNDTDVSRNVTLNWNSQNRSKNYALYLGESEENMVLKEDNITDNFYNIDTSLKENSSYYWEVVSNFLVNGVENSSKSGIMQFETGTSLEYNPDYFLLTVGIEEYNNLNFGNLNLTDEDSNDISKTFDMLNEPYSIKQLKGLVLKSDIEDAVTSISNNERASENDVLVFHYSGHGHLINDESILVMSNTPKISDEELFLSENISASKLKEIFAKFPGQKVIIIDACLSGSFTDMQTLSTSNVDNINDSSVSNFSNSFVTSFNQTSNDLEILCTDETTDYSNTFHVIAATGINDNEFSWEAKVLNNGIMSYTFVNALGFADESLLDINSVDEFDYSFEADIIINHKITIFELFSYTSKEVGALFNYYQRQGIIGPSAEFQNVSTYTSNPRFVFTTYFDKLN